MDTLWSHFLAVAQLSHFLLVSSLFGVLHSILSTSAASKMTARFGGSGLFRNSSKYATHLFLCCSLLAIFLPDLSFTGLCGLLYFLDRFLIVGVEENPHVPFSCLFSFFN